MKTKRVLVLGLGRFGSAVVEALWDSGAEVVAIDESAEAVDAVKERTSAVFLRPRHVPVPSGAGLHVGHPEGYTATDVLSRWKRMCGFNVLHPMGWDAFGLPAERAAVREGIHPAIITKRNVDNFRRQIKRLGFSYDWDREISTATVDYYKWTQWIFLKLYERGLAYRAEIPVNWCPALGTVLANEEVKDGRYVETGDPVERRLMRQWMLRSPLRRAAARRPRRGRLARGRQGDAARVDREAPRRRDPLRGRRQGRRDHRLHDAPRHALRRDVHGPRAGASAGRADHDGRPARAAVRDYVAAAAKKSDRERTGAEGEGSPACFTGAFAIHPFTGAKLPIWIADYVLASYGTRRDHGGAGARRARLGVRDEVRPPDRRSRAPREGDAEPPLPFVDEGVSCNSGPTTACRPPSAKPRRRGARAKGHRQGHDQLPPARLAVLAPALLGRALPDRLVDEQDRAVALPADALPVNCPRSDDFRPAPTAEPPLARATEWMKTTDPTPTGRRVRRTRDEHDAAVGGLVLVLPALPRPAERRRGVGRRRRRSTGCPSTSTSAAPSTRCCISSTRASGTRCCSTPASCRRGAVPEALQPGHDPREFGADAMRLYEMFMGPLEAVKPWQTKDIVGIARFLDKVWPRSSLAEASDLETDKLVPPP
jgi:leucyl-tRNA synthetase